MLIMKAMIIFSPASSSSGANKHYDMVLQNCDLISGANNEALPAHFRECCFEQCRFTMTKKEIEISDAFPDCYYEDCQFGVPYETFLGGAG